MCKRLIFISFLFLFSCQPKQTELPLSKIEMTKTYINPAQGYSQAVAVEANGIKTIHVSGQVGEGETFEAQFRDAL